MERTHIFDRIKTGMPVVQQSNNATIGTVEQVLYGEGLLRVQRALKANVFVYPNQISQVASAQVYLSVDESNLLKE